MDAHTLLFDWLLAASARASLLTVVVLIVQAVLRHRVPARWLYALWLPVLLVLLAPVFPESPWSVASIIQTAPASLPVPSIIEPGAALPVFTSRLPTTALPKPINWQQVMLFAWLMGASGVLLVGASSFARSLRQIKRTRLPLSEAWLSDLARLAREIGLRRLPQVWMASSVRGPAVTGFLRPTLLLPAQFDEALTPHEVRLVLTHELTHIKRGDLPLNALLCLLLALHWFNPLLWLAFFKARLDREAACDAQVLDNGNQTQRVAYGLTLLKVETAFSHHGLSLGFVGIFQRGTALRSRIRSIANQPKLNSPMKAMFALGIVLLTFLGITQAATSDANAPQIYITAKFIEISERDTAPTGVAPLPALLDRDKTEAGVVRILTDSQSQTILRELSQRKGVDLMSAPSVTTKAGQQAKIEVVREYEYKDEAGKPATKSTGVTFTVLPKLTANGQLDLDLSPQIVEPDGFVKHKSGWEEPIFIERKASERAVLNSGETFVLEMPSKIDKQLVQEEDILGRIVSSTTDTITRRTWVFATAYLTEPKTGKLEVTKEAEKSPIQTRLDTIILPSVTFHEASLTEAVEFLRAKSRDLDTATQDPKLKGVNIIIKEEVLASNPKITLDLKNVPLGEAVKYVAELSGLKASVQPYAVTLLAPAEFEAVQKVADAPVNPAGAIAKQFVLPSILFEQATLAEAVEYVRIKTRELDPARQGLNIVLKPGSDPAAKVTLSLKNVPASEVLRYCAELTMHKLTILDNLVEFAP